MLHAVLSHIIICGFREKQGGEEKISREQFYTMQANESVLIKTVEDQQLKIKE